jgi:DNA-binding MarR family transcriptional regulator
MSRQHAVESGALEGGALEGGAIEGGDTAGGDTGGRDIRNALGADLGWLLSQTLRGYLHSADQAARVVPGDMRGYLVLTAATRSCVNTQLGLAKELGLDRTVMTHLIDDLEGAGLIKRVPAPNDRRAKQIVITGAGRERQQRVAELLLRAEEHLLAPLGEEGRTAFRSHLEQLACRTRPDTIANCAVATEVCSAEVREWPGEPTHDEARQESPARP